MSDALTQAIEADDWPRARAILRSAIRREPEDHWLWTRLSMVLYEQRRYAAALEAAQRARSIAPRCPLVLWDLAGALQMLDRDAEALRVYRRILRIPLEELSHGECSEGRGRARGLVADCHFRISLSLQALGKRQQAIAALERHIDLRGPGCYSIYKLGELPGLPKRRSSRPAPVA